MPSYQSNTPYQEGSYPPDQENPDEGYTFFGDAAGTIGGSGVGSQPMSPSSSMGAGSQFAPITPIPSPPRKTLAEMMQDVDKLYTPETEATDKFNRLLKDFPQYERPSLGRTLVASGMALGDNGLENSQKFLNAPYIRDVAAWKELAGPAYNAANLERQSNVNQRTLASNMLTADAANRRADETERYNRDRVEISRINALANQARAQQWEVKVEDGIVIAYDPKNPQSIRTLGRIPGTTSEAEMAAIRGQWTINNTRQEGQNQATNQSALPTNQLRSPDGRVWEPDPIRGGYKEVPFWDQAGKRVNFGTTTPGAGGPEAGTTRIPVPGSPVGELEKGRIEQTARGNAWEQYPEVREWMTKTTRNGAPRYDWDPMPQVSKGFFGTGWGATTQEQVDSYIRARKAVEPNWQPPPPPAAIPNPSPSAGKGLAPGTIPNIISANPDAPESAFPSLPAPAAPGGGPVSQAGSPAFGSPVNSQGRVVARRQYNQELNQTLFTFTDGSQVAVQGLAENPPGR